LQSNAQSLKNISFKFNGEEIDPSSKVAQDLINRMMSASVSGDVTGYRDMNSNTSVSGEYKLAK
jgi:hypothetical protein